MGSKIKARALQRIKTHRKRKRDLAAKRPVIVTWRERRELERKAREPRFLAEPAFSLRLRGMLASSGNVLDVFMAALDAVDRHPPALIIDDFGQRPKISKRTAGDD